MFYLTKIKIIKSMVEQTDCEQIFLWGQCNTISLLIAWEYLISKNGWQILSKIIASFQ